MRRFLPVTAFALAALSTQARELPPVDALATAPAAKSALRQQDERLRAAHYDEGLGLPTFAWPDAVPIAKLARVERPEEAARGHLKSLAGLYRLAEHEIDAAPLHHAEVLAGGAHLVRLGNQRDGIAVFRESVAVLMDASMQRAIAIGGFIGPTRLASGALEQAPPTAFALSPQDAIAAALADYGFERGVASELSAAAPRAEVSSWRHFTLARERRGADGARMAAPARVRPVWFRLPEGLVAAYHVELEMLDAGARQSDFYAWVIAADGAAILFRHNQTEDAAFTYRAFADTSGVGLPFIGPQGRNGMPHPTALDDGYQAPFVAPNDVTLQAGPISTNDPWLPDGATRTIGNNVEAWANHSGPAAVPPATDPLDGTFDADPAECDLNAPMTGDFHACASGPGAFVYTFDPNQPPKAGKSQVMASVVNLFYVTNWLHDWFYDAGFREVDGNAQDDNRGRGGLGGDSMRAQAQDYAGTNNANMSTPSDGARPRMRMYVFTGNGSEALTILAPGAIAGNYAVATATFGPNSFDLTQDIAQAAPANGCGIVTGVAGKIALVDRGGCNFVVKAANVQAAGAVGMIVVNNQAGISGMSGTDPTVTIPALMVSTANGNSIKAQLSPGPVTARMRRATGIDRDGALDNSIIAHEWGHYISHRLVHDSTGITTPQSRGLGEGWSDFISLLMLVRAEDALVPSNAQYRGTYAEGAYAVDGPQLPGVTQSNAYYAGLRRYPYSSELAKNPLTYQHIQTGVALPASPPPAFTGDNAEVHNTGEVWTSMLWGCYSNLLRDTARLTFAQAQDRMKRYLVAGFKLTPAAPTMLEARDALLAAMVAGDPADAALCQAAFALRGAGAGARFTGSRYSSNNAGAVESFAVGAEAVIESLAYNGKAALYCDADSFLDNGETGTLSVTVKNVGTTALSGASLQLTTGTAGVAFPQGATQPIPAIAPFSSATVSFDVSLTGAPPTGTAGVTVTVTGTSIAAAASITFPVQRDRSPARSATDDVEDPQSAWTPSLQGTSETGQAWRRIELGPFDHRWNAPGGLTPGVAWLTSPPLQVSGTGAFSMSFLHRHAFEFSGTSGFDGGVIEVSEDGGTTWTDIETAIGSATVYNGTVSASGDNPFAGRRAFMGTNAGYPATATVNIAFPASFLGKTLRIRFGAGVDTSGRLEGWDVDDIAFANLVNTPFPGYVDDPHACVSASATGGTPQSANVNTAFGQPLVLRVLSSGQPVAGASVRFTAPGAGASGTFAAGLAASVLTDASGFATAPAFTANGTAGNYLVSASAGLATVTFSLTNVEPPVAPAVALEPASLDFGGQSMATTSPAMTVKITNSGATNLTVSSISSDNPRFATTHDCATVAPGAFCTASVTFSPTAAAGALNSTQPVSGNLSIASNATGSPHAVPLSGTAEKSLVTHYYRSILRRAPDSGGFQYWRDEAARLQSIGANVNEAWFAMAQFFYFSPEYTAFNRNANDFVTDLYNTFFNRAPDGGGLAFWTGQIGQGMPREVVLAAFMFSNEFATFAQAIFGNTAARAEVDVVMDFYRGLLARLPDAGGFDSWVSQFRTAQCQGAGAVYAKVEEISFAFANGTEYAGKLRTNAQYVGDLYNSFLRRGGDLAGVQFWIGELDSLRRTRDNVRQSFIASTEFQGRVANIVNQGCLGP